jgi:putative methionine-R-sulfoxide reductase with GAF domain
MEDGDALQILNDRRGKMYDPRVVDAFVEMHGLGLVATSSSQLPMLASAVVVPVRETHEHADADRGDLDLQTFFDLGRALHAATSTSQLGEMLWMHLRKRVPASAFVFYRHDGANDTIVSVYKAGDRAGEVDAASMPIGDRLSGWVAATAQTVMNSDARLDLDEPAREHSSLRSALAVPIVSNGQTAGVLSFYAGALNAFDDTHRRLVEAAAMAIADDVLRLASHFPPEGERKSQNSTYVLQNSNRL